MRVAISRATVAAARKAETLGVFAIAVFFVGALLVPNARGQLVLDGTAPVVDVHPTGQPVSGSGGAYIPSDVKHPVLPLEVKIRDLYPVLAHYGDRLTATLGVRNTGKTSLEIPCSRDLASDGAMAERGLMVQLRLIEGQMPVNLSIAAFVGSASVPGSLCTILPGATLLILGSGVIREEPKLEDPAIAQTSLNVRGVVRELYYDDKHIVTNISQASVSAETVSIYYLGRRPHP